MIAFGSFYGIITAINDFEIQAGEAIGCLKIMTVQKMDGSVVNFMISPNTYFVDHEMMKVGDYVIGFYDANAPVPMIYPPQYEAIVMAKLIPNRNVKVDYFNSQLLSSDGTLKLNIGPFTQIILENGQEFTKSPVNRDLIALYGPTTRSIPAQTTPYRIIVMCPKT